MKKAKKERGPRRIRAKYCFLNIDAKEGVRKLTVQTESGSQTIIVLPVLDLDDINCAIAHLSGEAARIIKRDRQHLLWRSQRAARSVRLIADAMTCDLEGT